MCAEGGKIAKLNNPKVKCRTTVEINRAYKKYSLEAAISYWAKRMYKRRQVGVRRAKGPPRRKEKGNIIQTALANRSRGPGGAEGLRYFCIARFPSFRLFFLK